MKVTLVSTTNSAVSSAVGKEGTLSLSNTAFFEFNAEGCDWDLRHGSFRTSQLLNITFNEISFNCFNITITTRNSTYVFREGAQSEKPPLTQEEILEASLAFGLF